MPSSNFLCRKNIAPCVFRFPVSAFRFNFLLCPSNSPFSAAAPSGNCAYVETAEARILVDAGFSPRQIRQRLAGIGRTPENLSAILITHEHADHIAGLLGLADKFHIPVFCNRGTQDGTIWAFKTKWSKKTKSRP